MFKSIWMLVFMGCILVACKEQDTIKDVPYYEKHPEERKQKITQCKNNPGELEHTPNCKNAFEAERLYMFSPEGKKEAERSFKKSQEEFKRKLDKIKI